MLDFKENVSVFFYPAYPTYKTKQNKQNKNSSILVKTTGTNKILPAQ